MLFGGETKNVEMKTFSTKDTGVIKECVDQVMTFCKLLTESSKNEDWFIYTGIILNVALLLAITIFFEKMFGLSSSEINKSCRNSEMERNLNNVIAAFFIVNVLVQIINIILQAITNLKTGQWNQCDKLVGNLGQQQMVYNQKNRLFYTANVIRIILILVVLILLMMGIYLNTQCKQNRRHEQGDVNSWYAYFNTPRVFTDRNTNNNKITIWYDYSDAYKEGVMNDVPTKDLNSELKEGIWYIIPREDLNPIPNVDDAEAYRYKKEYYIKDETDLTLAYRLDWDEIIDLTYNYADYKNDNSYYFITYNGITFDHTYEKMEEPVTE
jgi:hypothetical protein